MTAIKKKRIMGTTGGSDGMPVFGFGIGASVGGTIAGPGGFVIGAVAGTLAGMSPWSEPAAKGVSLRAAFAIAAISFAASATAHAAWTHTSAEKPVPAAKMIPSR